MALADRKQAALRAGILAVVKAASEPSTIRRERIGEVMTVQTLKLGRERFVVLREKDYRELKAKSRPSGKARRPSGQDQGDMAEHRRRLAEPGGTPLAKVRRRLGV